MVDFKPCDCDICEEIKEESKSDFCECILCTDTYDGEDRPTPGMEDESMTTATIREEKLVKESEEEYDRAHEDYYKEPSFKDEGGF